MGRERSNLLWPARKKALVALRNAGVYGYINEALVHAKAIGSGKDLPEIRFVIFGQGRTGSRLLCDLLHSHPDITCDLEILADLARSPRGLVEAYARMAKTRAHGFKVKNYQLTERQRLEKPGEFVHQLCDDGWKLIYLSRSNVVRHALSSIVREATGVTHRLNAKKDEYPKVHVDPDDLRRWVDQKLERRENELASMGELPRLEIVYDDDLLGEEAQDRTTAKVVEWLGLPPADMKAKIRPNTPRSLDDLVENVDELREVFAGSDIEGYLR